MSTPFLGEIRMFGGNFAPRGWALCNGQLMSISQNTALFSILGTTFGGDGQQTFGLPDLRGRVPVHPGQGPGLSQYVLGESTGTENVTLLITNMPAHNHLVNATENGTTSDPSGMVPGPEPNRGTLYGTADGTTMAPTMTNVVGGSQPHNNLQPLLCVNFIIALQGLFPTRN